MLELIQRDTYFNVAIGRLKLREERDAAAHLISDLRVKSPRVESGRGTPHGFILSFLSTLALLLSPMAAIDVTGSGYVRALPTLSREQTAG